MDSTELFFLVMVCGPSAIFAAVLGASYVKYRGWLKDQPHACLNL